MMFIDERRDDNSTLSHVQLISKKHAKNRWLFFNFASRLTRLHIHGSLYVKFIRCINWEKMKNQFTLTLKELAGWTYVSELNVKRWNREDFLRTFTFLCYKRPCENATEHYRLSLLECGLLINFIRVVIRVLYGYLSCSTMR